MGDGAKRPATATVSPRPHDPTRDDPTPDDPTLDDPALDDRQRSTRPSIAAMFCNRCGRQAEAGQDVCTECGRDLDVPEPTRPIETIETIEPTQRLDAVDASTTPAPAAAPETETARGPAAVPPPPPPSDLRWAAPMPPAPPAAPPAPVPVPAPAPVAPPRVYDLADDEPDLLRDTPAVPIAPVTDRLVTEQLGAATVEAPLYDEVVDDDDSLFGPFRLGVVPVLGVLTGMTALFGLFPRVVAIRTDATSPSFVTGDWFVGDLGGNLVGAMVVALVALLVGAIGAGFGQRWAAGMVGGAGLAIAGWSTLVIGLSERPLSLAVDAVGRPTTEAFTVTLTRDVSYWVLLVAGALGMVTFVVSLVSAGRDRSAGLNPWIAALGAAAAVVAAAGPLIPEGAAVVSDNWTPDAPGAPVWFVAGRLVQLGLLAYTGVVGFLLVRSYGLGLVIGGLSATTWLVVSTLLDLGEGTVGPGYTNPGDTGSVDLHAVTIVGTTALVGLTLVAVIAAVEQSSRSSR